MPPTGHKDARAWFVSQHLGEEAPAWRQAGEKFVAELVFPGEAQEADQPDDGSYAKLVEQLAVPDRTMIDADLRSTCPKYHPNPDNEYSLRRLRPTAVSSGKAV
jgi:hypothetical protein